MARQRDNLQPWLNLLRMTEEEVAETYRDWYEAAVTEMGRDAALAMFAQALYTSVGSAQRYASWTRLPAGEFLALLCHRIEKARGFELEVDDPRLDEDIWTLLQARLRDKVNRDAERLREDLNVLDARERGLDEREIQLAEREQKLAERSRRLDEWAGVVHRRAVSVSARERKVEEREGAVKAEVARMKRVGEPTNALEVVAREMRPGGRLALSSTKSLLRAKVEIDEQLAGQRHSNLSISGATRRRVQREEKEKVLAILTAPIRLLVHWLMP